MTDKTIIEPRAVPKTVLITGVYGFLGYSTAIRLLERGHKVIGLDRVTNAKSEKSARIDNLAKYPEFRFMDINLANYDQLRVMFELLKFDQVMHFAAQYAVKHSPESMQSYVTSNVAAFMNVLELTRQKGLNRFTYASSTFVEDGVLPTSMYGATKKFNEDAAHMYSAQFGMTTVGLRYGSCFGPWCRNDVGIYITAKRIMNQTPIKVTDPFHYQTAFLYSRDATEATLRILDQPSFKDKFNTFTVVAEDHRKDMGEILKMLEKHLGVKANVDWTGYKEKGPGGIPQAQCDKLRNAIGYAPSTTVDEAVGKFATWFKGRWEAGKA